MNKRNVATILWFLAGWSGGGLLVGIYGLPSVAAFVPAILFAAMVRLDPAHLLWSRSAEAQRRVVPVNDFAHELDRRIDSWPAVESDTTRV